MIAQAKSDLSGSLVNLVTPENQTQHVSLNSRRYAILVVNLTSAHQRNIKVTLVQYPVYGILDLISFTGSILQLLFPF